MNDFLPFPCDRVAVVAITRHGLALAGRVLTALPGARLCAPAKFAEFAQSIQADAHCYAGRTADQIPALFEAYDGIVAIVSLGAMVRLVAPHLGDKSEDPGVVVLDEAGRFVIPMLSGHLGGANALASRLARALDAQEVLTTASDARQTLAVDLLGREFGWTFEARKQALVAASAAVVNDEPVALVQECGPLDWWVGHANGRNTPLPQNIELLDELTQVDPARHRALLWISQRDEALLPPALRGDFMDCTVIYRPPVDHPA